MQAAREGFRPFLLLRQKRYDAVGLTTQQLAFELANDDVAPYVDPITICFGCPHPPPLPPLRFASLDLVVPFEERRFLVLKRRRELTFRLLIGVLWGGPGTFTFITPVFAHERQTLKSETVRQASGGAVRKRPGGPQYVPAWKGDGCRFRVESGMRPRKRDASPSYRRRPPAA